MEPIRSGVSLANVGYALPGSVLAVSIMLAFSYLDRELVVPLSGWLGGAGEPLLLGSLSALVLAYLVPGALILGGFMALLATLSAKLGNQRGR